MALIDPTDSVAGYWNPVTCNTPTVKESKTLTSLALRGRKATVGDYEGKQESSKNRVQVDTDGVVDIRLGQFFSLIPPLGVVEEIRPVPSSLPNHPVRAYILRLQEEGKVGPHYIFVHAYGVEAVYE